MDTIVGKKQTKTRRLSEHGTRGEIIIRIKDRRAEAAIAALNHLGWSTQHEGEIFGKPSMRTAGL